MGSVATCFEPVFSCRLRCRFSSYCVVSRTWTHVLLGLLPSSFSICPLRKLDRTGSGFVCLFTHAIDVPIQVGCCRRCWSLVRVGHVCIPIFRPITLYCQRCRSEHTCINLLFENIALQEVSGSCDTTRKNSEHDISAPTSSIRR